MKKISKLICIILSSLFLFALVAGCSRETVSPPTPTTPLDTAKDADGSTIMLTENGSSRYRIVIPENAAVAEELAASRLAQYIQEATGAVIPVVADTGLSYNEECYYISVGETTLLEGSDITVSYDVLGPEGVFIANRGRQIFVTGAESDGTLYAAQEFLSKQVGFEVYYTDEIYLNDQTDVPVYNYHDYISVPDIEEGRWVGCGNFASFADSSLMRFQYGYADGSFNSEGNIWGSWSHSMPQLGITRDEYPEEEYDDWFFGESQYCFSQMSLADEAAKQIVARIPQYPNAKYWQIGDGDSNRSCDCEDCQANREKYGTQGGIMMAFLNRVGEQVEKLMAEQNITDREILILGLAYEGTAAPPTHYDEFTESYVANEPAVIARHNVGMMYAPITDCTHHSYNDTRCIDHQTRIDRMLGWSAVVPDNLSLWLYNTNFRDYFLPYNDWGGIKDDAAMYEDMGVTFIFSQSCKNGRYSFDALRLYLRSKLWWDSSLDYNTLFENFFNNYYKAAAPEMLEYFNLIQSHYMELYATLSGTRPSAGCGNCFDAPTYYGMGNWSYQYLMKAKDIMQRAYDKVANSGLPANVREKLNDRIRVEEVYIDGYLWNYYATFYSTDDYKALEDDLFADCASFGISWWDESSPLVRKA